MDKSIAERICEHEEQLLQSHIRRSPQEVAALLADEFVEYGNSGRIYDKQSIIESLQNENAMQITLSKFKATILAPDVVLANYLSAHRNPDGTAIHTLRSSIWKQIDGRWQMIFHQGTRAEEPR